MQAGASDYSFAVDVDAGVEQHCSSWHGGHGEPCRGVSHASLKQRRLIQTLSRLTLTPVPDIEAMSVESAGRWIEARWVEWMSQ